MPHQHLTDTPIDREEDLPELLKCIPELEEDLPPEMLAEPENNTGYIAAAIALLLILATLAYLRFRKKTPTVIEIAPEETAINSLQALSKACPDVRECSLQLSMILRRYLTGATQDPALFETHEEFSNRLNALSSIPASCQYPTRVLLEKLAELKYAGIEASDSQRVEALINETKETILNIHEARLKAAEGDRLLEKVKSTT